jgi:hypothetical protein
MHAKLQIAFVIGLLTECLSGRAMADCLEYGTNSLSGTLVHETHAGPPDYRRVAGGDKPVVVWVLLLDEWICVVDPDSRIPHEYHEREVQLVLEEFEHERYGNFLGKRVIVTGDLRHGHGDYKRLLVVPRETVQTNTRR